MSKNKKPKIVNHHILYQYSGTTHKQEEWIMPVYFTEHYLLTQLQRRGKVISKGFLTCLKLFILQNENIAQDLSMKIWATTPPVTSVGSIGSLKRFT